MTDDPRSPEAQFLAIYRTQNESHPIDCVYRLSTRGFFSEINNLLNAMAVCLLTRMRLHVDTRKFGGLNWDALFHLPNPAPLDPDAARVPLLEADGSGGAGPAIRKVAVRLAETARDLDAGALGRFETFFDLKATLARNLLVRRFEAGDAAPGASLFEAARRQALAETPFGPDGPPVAFHVRRGDKTEGFLSGERLIVEGEDVPPEEYLAAAREARPDHDAVFVMTDDTTVLPAFEALAPDTRFVTLSPEQTGYFHAEFVRRSAEAREHAMRRLLVETQIAASAGVFVCGLKSNVGRFVHLWAAPDQRLVSVDRVKAWTAR